MRALRASCQQSTRKRVRVGADDVRPGHGAETLDLACTDTGGGGTARTSLISLQGHFLEALRRQSSLVDDVWSVSRQGSGYCAEGSTTVMRLPFPAEQIVRWLKHPKMCWTNLGNAMESFVVADFLRADERVRTS